jgi:hypothetical protein
MWTARDVASAICSARACTVSPVRSLLAARPPGALRHNLAAPAGHRALPPSRCLRGWGAGCPATPETGPAAPPASAPRQPTVAVGCADRQGGCIGQPPAASEWMCENRPRRVFRHPSKSPCATGMGRSSVLAYRLRIARRGCGVIAAGWWSWHPSLISRDASRVQWIGTHHQLGVLTAICRRRIAMMNR